MTELLLAASRWRGVCRSQAGQGVVGMHKRTRNRSVTLLVSDRPCRTYGCNFPASPHMLDRPCPQCGQPARALTEVSRASGLVDYYRCAACGPVWWYRKGDANAPPLMVSKHAPAKAP